jgi:hypothetical protein
MQLYSLDTDPVFGQTLASYLGVVVSPPMKTANSRTENTSYVLCWILVTATPACFTACMASRTKARTTSWANS